jgi:uncharacterized protein YrzB (UPF0473 family)
MIDPYYIYVTLHLMECSSESFAQEACDTKWDIASEVYQKFLDSKHNVETKSEYDCIEEFLTHTKLDY